MSFRHVLLLLSPLLAARFLYRRRAFLDDPDLHAWLLGSWAEWGQLTR